MSVQACRIKGYGHILKNGVLPPRFNKIEDTDESEFWEESGVKKDYWFFAKLSGDKNTEKESPIGACFNYMSGDEYFIGVITEANYIECSDYNWDRVKFRNDDWVKKYHDKRIKDIFGITEPSQEVEFEIYQ